MPETQNELSALYGAHREMLAQNTAASELLMRYSKNAEAPAPTKQPGNEAEKDKSVAADVGVMGTAGAVASDIGRGVVDAPGAVVSGVRNAAQEFLDTTADLGDWIDSNLLGLEAIPEDERLLKVPELPEGLEPDSVTGSIIKGVTQFLTGFGVAGKALKAMKPVGAAGKAAKVMTQGAIADAGFFDPHEGRLSNLIQQYPTLQNPVTEYLAADPTDSNAEGRFKNAVEGLGLGIVADGFIKAVKVVRSAAMAKRASDVTPVIDDARPAIADDAFKMLGDDTSTDLIQDAPAVAKVNQADEVVTLPTDGGNKGDMLPDNGTAPDDLKPAMPEKPETFINFARIDSPDDVKAVMQQMADRFKGNIDEARRGETRSFKQMELDAQHVNAFETLAKRRQGEPLNAEQSVAARQLWATSADKLSALAKAAASDPSEANLFAFRKMVAVHRTIQNEVIAARTETARALASWRIPAGSGAERFAEIENVLTLHGGTDLSREMAQRISTLADKGMIQEMDAFIEKGAWAKSRDAMLEAWINGLLSGPKTHVVNMLSNTSVIFQQMYERNTAAKIARALGDEQSVQSGEAMAQLYGMLTGLKDAFRYAGKSFVTGDSGFGLGKVEAVSNEYPRAISSEALNISSSGFVGRTVDVLGTAINVPTKALGAADEFFKTIGYRMELHALALRQATQEMNAGQITKEAFKDRIAEIIENPPESIRLSAIDQATYQTFTNKPGELAQALSRMKIKAPVLNILIPFVRTPANIMRYTFERTPLAPLMKHYRSDIAAGGARRDIALARMATGTSIMMMTADMAMTGNITGKGPSDNAERSAMTRLGWQPYSVKVGDRYYAYNRLDPLGMTMGLAADMSDILANDEYGEEKEKTMEEASIAVAMSIANNAMSKTYLSGLSGFFEAMTDPERYGESYFQRLASSTIPTISGEVARAQDPYMREANNMLEAMRRKVPGLSDELPPRRNLWGEPIGYQSGLGTSFDVMSPIYSKAEVRSPIDEEILRLEANVTMPNKKTSFDGVTVNLERFPGAYSRFVELAGNEIKHPAWDKGAKDFLNELVTGNHMLSPVYEMRSDGPDGGKSDYINKILNDYRDLAREQLLREYPELKLEVERKKQEKRQMKMPVFTGGGVAG